MPDEPRDKSDQTSDRLYSPEELREFESMADPLSDPLPGDRSPDGAPQPPGVTNPAPRATAAAAEPPPPPPSSPPGSPSPVQPPQSPFAPPSGQASGQPSEAPPAPPHPAAPAGPPEPPAQEHTLPRTTAPVAPSTPQSPPHSEVSTQSAPATPAESGEPRRFMTATDFLDRRTDTGAPGPATWGWRSRVRRWSGGMVNPKMGAAERAHEERRTAIQRDFAGPRTIAFINPKGGAAKTTGVLGAGYTFGTVRGGGVVAWDNNETRGTLGIRGIRGSHRNTTRELLEDLGRFSDVFQSRIGDLGAFVRNQGDAHFDVLASDESAHVTGQIHADDFHAVHQLLERFYRIILVDTGNNMRAENWLAAAEAADLLVVTSTMREDTGYSGLWMLDALQDAGYTNLKYKTITVLSEPSATVDEQLAADLVDVYEQRTRGVFRVPYDPVLVSGSVVPYGRLSEGTRESWLRACAAMAEAL